MDETCKSKRAKRAILPRLAILIVKPLCLVFFNKRYLKGKYFDDCFTGWRWALRSIVWQKIFGYNRKVPWPVSAHIIIANPGNIEFDVDDMNNFQTMGNYFSNGHAKIVIGKGTLIAPNVGIITENHDPYDLENYQKSEEVSIGDNCWIGMNAIILPGVKLGHHTIVGAGSVVTKSFEEGDCIIAGNPAKIISKL